MAPGPVVRVASTVTARSPVDLMPMGLCYRRVVAPGGATAPVLVEVGARLLDVVARVEAVDRAAAHVDELRRGRRGRVAACDHVAQLEVALNEIGHLVVASDEPGHLLPEPTQANPSASPDPRVSEPGLVPTRCVVDCVVLVGVQVRQVP